MSESELVFTDAKLWQYLKWNAFLSTTHKLLYVATPKAACTSLKWWFASIEGYCDQLIGFADSAESDPELTIHDVFHKVAPDVTGLEPVALRDGLLSSEYFRFAVVRNPYRRIFSAWQSKLLLREPLQVGPYKDCDFLHIPLRKGSDVAIAFEAFLEYLALAEAPHYLDMHWTPQATLLRPDLIAYSKIVQIEHISELTDLLRQHIHTEMPNVTEFRSNESLIPFSSAFVTERSKFLIETFYAEDFEQFGYASVLPAPGPKLTNAEFDLALRAIKMLRGRHVRLAQTRESASIRIRRLTEETKRQNREAVALQQAVAAHRDESLKLEGVRDELEMRVVALKKELASRQQRLVELEEHAAALESDSATLQQDVADLLERVTNDSKYINQLLTSSSWRITQPLRWVAIALRNAKRGSG